MNQLIAVSQADIGGERVQAVDARELHIFLEVGTAFKDWMSRRIEEYGFRDGVDFCSFLSKSSGGRPAKEYSITLDMAKELSMVERNTKGKQARQYFIECERRLRSGVAQPALKEDPRVTAITAMRDSGLITPHEARARAIAILDQIAPIPSKQVKVLPAKEKPWRRAAPSGERVGPLMHGQTFRLDELHYWVKGGNRELFRALREGGFIDGNDNPTEKGKRLFAGDRKGHRLVHAEKLLRAIGAWQ